MPPGAMAKVALLPESVQTLSVESGQNLPPSDSFQE
jgi:hypothetical protein